MDRSWLISSNIFFLPSHDEHTAQDYKTNHDDTDIFSGFRYHGLRFPKPRLVSVNKIAL